MKQTFVNLPSSIEHVITTILKDRDNDGWVKHASELHERYVGRDKAKGYIRDSDDALAYLAMRVPATFAQHMNAFASVAELTPTWKPTTMLDIGSGPATAAWAATEIWPSITTVTAIDTDANLLAFGERINNDTQLLPHIQWVKQDIRRHFDESTFDLVVIGNVLNELSPAESEKIIGRAFNACSGALFIIESGTPLGSSIASASAKKLSKAGYLLAPYVGNTYVASRDYWLHFPQRFIRPEFSRRIRQHMREAPHMASDWEEAKYAYAAISKFEPEVQPWGRVVGPTKIQKGFLEIPILTAEKIEMIKIRKRDKTVYDYAKELKWGDLVIEQKFLAF